MQNTSPALQLFLNLAKSQSLLSRRFNSGLAGIGFTEFIIMYHLNEARDGKLRRIDLADKVGLTASGITRLLAPMEKIGLVKREVTEHDARVSQVTLSASGKRQLEESLAEIELLAGDILPETSKKELTDVTTFLETLAHNIK